MTKISRKPEEAWADLVTKCFEGKLSEAHADVLLTGVEASKPRSKKMPAKGQNGGQKAPDQSPRPPAPVASPSDAQPASLADQEPGGSDEMSRPATVPDHHPEDELETEGPTTAPNHDPGKAGPETTVEHGQSKGGSAPNTRGDGQDQGRGDAVIRAAQGDLCAPRPAFHQARNVLRGTADSRSRHGCGSATTTRSSFTSRTRTK